jgi:hypothetical protein
VNSRIRAKHTEIKSFQPDIYRSQTQKNLVETRRGWSAAK